MSAFRGARLLASLGHHGIKCNRLHQRRIVSLGLTSLCQVTTKKRALLDTNALPVNKFDLSSVGILSPTLSTLFSTEALALSEDESNELAEDESSEAGRIIQVSKWPSPLKHPSLKENSQKKYSAFIGGYNFNHNEEYLRKLFVQFGEVEELTIPHKTRYDETECRPKQYRYGFISFVEHSSLKRAVAAVSITTPDNTTIEVKERSDPARKSENKRTFMVNALPDDVTIQQVHDYFKSFAQVELVNLVLKTNTSTSSDNRMKKNYAFVLFKSGSDVQSLPHLTHYIGSERISIIPVAERTKRQSRDRCRMIFVSGLDEGMSEEHVRTHFDQVGLVRNVKLFTDDNGVGNGLAVVNFEDKEAALSTAETRWHDIGDTTVKAQLLGILNE